MTLLSFRIEPACSTALLQAPQGFQEQKQAARKDNAGNRAAWNALFMRPDTVSAAVAAHYGISKAQLLDRDAAGRHLRHGTCRQLGLAISCSSAC